MCQHVMLHLTVLKFLKYKNVVFNGEQEKESIICMRMG